MEMTTLPLKSAPPGLPGPVQWLPGLALAALLAVAALHTAPAVRHLGLSAMSLAIVLGMVVGNTLYPRLQPWMDAGIAQAKGRVLRLAIVLYGLRLTLQDVGSVGMTGVLIDAVVVGATFTLAVGLGTRWLGMDRDAAMLIGAGSSICGAAAVLATEPVVRGRPEQVAVAVATVVVFGTLAMFLYPVLFHLNSAWGLIAGGEHAFGIYIGSTVHEVAQVVVAGDAISPQAADAAVITKMVRVMLLAPFLVILSAWLAREPQAGRMPRTGAPHAGRRIAIPWFAFGFIAVVLLNSLVTFPPALKSSATALDDFLLAMAMGALGLTTHVGAIRRAGLKPLLLALLLFAWLVLGGALLNAGAQRWLG
ncbi:YeiH family protein [Comamonas badia]|uniref:YeiH family protein n=1 Tax=Comamonas badia TaxID=265291 RepID=UPI000551AE05